MPDEPFDRLESRTASGLSPIRDRTLMVIVGLHSSGKTTLARALAETVGDGRRILEMGDVVRHEASARHRRNLVQLADELIRNDPLYIVARLQDRAAGVPPESLVVVGPRTSIELNALRQHGPTLVIGVQTPDKIRHSRWQRRRLSYADTWQERETLEREWGTRELLELSDIVVEGQGWPRYAAEEVRRFAEGGTGAQ